MLSESFIKTATVPTSSSSSPFTATVSKNEVHISRLIPSILNALYCSKTTHNNLPSSPATYTSSKSTSTYFEQSPSTTKHHIWDEYRRPPLAFATFASLHPSYVPLQIDPISQVHRYIRWPKCSPFLASKAGATLTGIIVTPTPRNYILWPFLTVLTTNVTKILNLIGDMNAWHLMNIQAIDSPRPWSTTSLIMTIGPSTVTALRTLGHFPINIPRGRTSSSYDLI